MPQLPSLPWTFTILTPGDSWGLWAQLRMLPGAHQLSFPSRYYPVFPAHAPPLLICTLFWVWEAIALLLPWCSAPLHLLCDGPSLSRASTGTLPLLPSTHSIWFCCTFLLRKAVMTPDCLGPRALNSWSNDTFGRTLLLSLLHKEEVTRESKFWYTNKVSHFSGFTADKAFHLQGDTDSAKRYAHTLVAWEDTVPCSLGHQCLGWPLLFLPSRSNNHSAVTICNAIVLTSWRWCC